MLPCCQYYYCTINKIKNLNSIESLLNIIIHININTPTYPSKSQFNYYLLLARKEALRYF